MTDGTTIIPPGGLVESSGWQPIETAPMDGTEVVLYYPCYLDGGFVTAGYWRAGTDVYEPHWYSDLVNGGASPPTKWQPLPQPPTELALMRALQRLGQEADATDNDQH